MRVYESQLPGVGVKYRLSFGGEPELVILMHNDETVEWFWRAAPDEDADRLFAIDAEDARKIADVLDGTYFHPVEDGLDDILEDARVRWVEVDERSSVADRTIGDVGIRSRTGVTILGIRRDGRLVPEVGASTRMLADDVLIAVGDEESHDAFRELLAR